MNHIHIHHSVKVTMREIEASIWVWHYYYYSCTSPYPSHFLWCGRWGLRVYQLSFFLDCNIPNHSTLSQLQSKKLDHYHCN